MRLDAWTPIRVHGTVREPLVDWAVLDAPSGEPFFEQSADRAMRHPFNQLFSCTTPLEALDVEVDELPVAEPAGFVFHMSRCGSTLIAQMLSRLTSTVVLSEPQPLDGILRLRRLAALDEESALRRFRTMLRTLSRPHRGEQRSFVKFHAWHVLDLPFIARSFPDTPWIFAFREPRAVLRSQENHVGAEMIPGTLDPRFAGIEPAAVTTMSPLEYCARLLSAFCDAALARAASTLFVDYDRLPDAVLTGVLPFFGVASTEEEIRGMREIAQRDTKGRGGEYRAAREPDIPPEIERLATRWLDPAYAAMRDSGQR